MSRASRLSSAGVYIFDMIARCIPALILSVLASLAAAAPPRLGDCGAVLAPDGSIDVRATVASLRSLHANTFAYLIHESPSAWEQLPEFAEAAGREGIEVWVYLVPWSAVPPVKKNKPPCEPFGTDFVRWAAEIGKLARRHPNITAILLDDFAINDEPGRFSPTLIEDMKATLGRSDDKVKLYALLYFNSAWARFVDRYAGVLDGAVVCYPQSQRQIDSALNYLNGNAHGASLMAEMTKDDIGDASTVVMRGDCRPGPGTKLQFLFDHANFSQADGEHTAFVRIDGRVIWERHVDSRSESEVITLDLSADHGSMKIELGFTGQRPGEKSECFIRFDDVLIVERQDRSVAQPPWKLINPAQVRATLGLPGSGSGVAMTTFLMPATDPAQYAKRYDGPVIADTILAKLQLCLDNLEPNRAAGVINFYTPKTDDSRVHRETARRFREQR